MDLDSNWKVLKGTIAGKPGIVRINAGLAPIAGKAPYVEELVLTVKIEHPDEYGMPTAAETQQLNAFEDLLRPILQEDLQSLLALVMTSDGFRDYVFYTKSPMGAVTRLQLSVAPSFMNLEVDVNGRPDAGWERFQRFIGVE